LGWFLKAGVGCVVTLFAYIWKEGTMDKPTIKVTLELAPHGVKNIYVNASTSEGRDEAVERLRRCLPQIELLESALQAETK
jgi:hypothetical protein